MPADAPDTTQAPFPGTFHPATRAWFSRALGTPTPAQIRGWRAIGQGLNTLIAAPTGSGKTLAAFLSAIDELVREAKDGRLSQTTRIVYISPLKALGNDVDRNLAAPLAGISKIAAAHGVDVRITTAVRTGDTSPAERAAMVRRPPHILVTTPEGLYALVTSTGGRAMLADTRTVIVDEIHALAPDRRGAHLSITLERLAALVARPLQRIGLSATQKPVQEVARFLVGAGRACEIIDEGHGGARDLRIELPGSPLLAVMENEVWEEVYDRVVDLAAQHRTTLVFVNSRRLCERVAHTLGQRVGPDAVAAHHGSLSPPLRLHAEARLKAGDLRLLVATASLELGIDIGDVDLVIQLGSVKRIAMFLQRVGRANHHHGGIPKGRLFPLNRDDLVDAVALLRCVDQGVLDHLVIPGHPLDVLAQQIVAATVAAPWSSDDLYALVRQAYPYRTLCRADFDAVADMLATGFPTERGRRGQLVHNDRVNGILSARKGARMTALASGGTIPDSGDYTVRLDPQGVVVGAIAEDFAIHQMPGHVIQLGSNTWRILQVRADEVRVEPAPGEAPYMPVWFGELPARSDELSREVSCLRAEVAAAPSTEAAADRLLQHAWLDRFAADQLAAYLRSAGHALGAMPTGDTLVAERFSDLAGNAQVVMHAPLGVRVNRAWALAIRHILGRRHAVEIQAAATDDGFLLSLPGTVTVPLDEVFGLVEPGTVERVVAEAVLAVPMFMIRWRWAASRALQVPRMRGGRRVPPHIQRTDADELLLSAIPGAAVGHPLRVEAKRGGANSRRDHPDTPAIPDHPLVQQTLRDCLHEAMDVTALRRIVAGIAAGTVAVRTANRLGPSPGAFGVVTAKPPAFLDNGALMDRRARNVAGGPRHLSLEAETAVHPDAVARVRAELAPDLATPDDLATHLSLSGIVTEREMRTVRPWLAELEDAGRAVRFRTENGSTLWAAAEWLPKLAAVFPALRQPHDGPADLDPDAVLSEVLRGRLETSGPVTTGDVATGLGLAEAPTERALARLEAEGAALHGAFDPDRPGEMTWCDRRVLARIDRLTRNKLRADIEPVSLQQFYRFLLRWHGLDGPDRHDRHQGRDGLAKVLAMLDGVEVPAGLWEDSIISARVDRYRMDDLDELCLSGRFGWGRLSMAADGAARQGLTKATPIALFDAEHVATWRALARPGGAGPPLSARATKLRAAFEARGASFIGQIQRSVRMLDAEYEMGLMELVGAGLLTADSFAGLRALLAKPSKLRVSRLDVIGNSNSGRWSLLPIPDAAPDPVAHDAAVEAYAGAVLRRYGVVVRSVVARENTSVRWLDLLRTLRRMEARGAVRGGYFVDGAGGEHFALPDALPILRETRATDPAGALIGLSAADPLNLTGTLTDGARVPNRTTARILLRDGIPIACEDRNRIKMLGDRPNLTPAERHALRHSPAPPGLAVYR